MKIYVKNPSFFHAYRTIAAKMKSKARHTTFERYWGGRGPSLALEAVQLG